MKWVSETSPRMFRYDSCFISGATNSLCGGTATPAGDGLDWGPNWNKLQAAQYAIAAGPNALAITATSATISFAPLGAGDVANGCGVDVGTDPNFGAGNYTRVAGSAGVSQGVSVGSLGAGTIYYVRVNCQVNQPTLSFITLP
jgi:hypothetical protein